MPSKRSLEQMKSARAAAVQSLKRRKFEASSVLSSAQLEVDDDKLSTAERSDTEDESGAWFLNESANESDSDTEGGDEEEEDDENESDLDGEEPRTERAVSPEI